jgi:hypothetical protein
MPAQRVGTDSHGNAACVTSASLAAVRAMSLSLNLAPWSAARSASVDGGPPAASKAASAQFPPITAVFVAIEGAERLLHPQQDRQQAAAMR